jgi:DNA-binding NarL/FixJ family response regulator
MRVCSFLLLLFPICLLGIDQSYLDSLKKREILKPGAEAELSFQIAKYFYDQTYGYADDQDSVIFYLNAAIEQSKRLRNDSLLADCYMLRGKVLSREGLFAESNKELKQAQYLYKNLGDSLYVSKIDYLVAYNYMDLGMYDVGIPHLEKAMKRSASTKDTLFLGSLNLAMGSFLTSMRNFRESRVFTKKAIQYFSKGNQLPIGGAYVNLARSYALDSIYDSSYYYYQRAITIWKGLGYERGLGVLYNNLSEFFVAQKKFNRAIDYLLLGEELLKKVGDKKRLSDAYLKMADCYLLQYKTKIAWEYLQKAEALGEENRTFSFQHELDRLKAVFYEQRGDYKKAYDAQKAFLRRADTLVTQKGEERILESKRRLEFIQKSNELKLEEASIKALQQEKKLLKSRQTITLIIVVCIVLILLVLTILIVRNKRHKQEMLEAKLLASKTANNELEEEISLRKKKLSSYALQMIDKNQKLDQLKEELKEINQLQELKETEVSEKLYKLQRKIDQAINTEENWQEFKLYFEEVHTSFFKELQAQHGNLTSRDLRLAALLRLNLTTKEIANLLNLPVKTIEVSRYRLRKKLELSSDENLVDYMISF